MTRLLTLLTVIFALAAGFTVTAPAPSDCMIVSASQSGQAMQDVHSDDPAPQLRTVAHHDHATPTGPCKHGCPAVVMPLPVEASTAVAAGRGEQPRIIARVARSIAPMPSEHPPKRLL